MKLTDYTLEYCPNCDNEVVIHTHGVTRCPVCGASLAPCSVCIEEQGGCKAGIPCSYGCNGTENDLYKPVTCPDMTQKEIDWFLKNY